MLCWSSVWHRNAPHFHAEECSFTPHLKITKITNSIIIIIYAYKSQAAVEKPLPLSLHSHFVSIRGYVFFKSENIRRKKDIDIIKNGKSQQHMRHLWCYFTHTKARHQIPATSVQQSACGPGSRFGLHRFYELPIWPPTREDSAQLLESRLLCCL